jgi:hypothetical protein
VPKLSTTGHIEVLGELRGEVADELIECLGSGDDVVGPAHV